MRRTDHALVSGEPKSGSGSWSESGSSFGPFLESSIHSLVVLLGVVREGERGQDSGYLLVVAEPGSPVPTRVELERVLTFEQPFGPDRPDPLKPPDRFDGGDAYPHRPALLSDPIDGDLDRFTFSEVTLYAYDVWIPLPVRFYIGEDLPDGLRRSVDLDFGSYLSHSYTTVKN